MKDRKNQSKLHKFYCKMKPVLAVFVVFLGIFLGTTFAKYYSLQKQKGVAVASDFYFSSDILKTGVEIGENNVPSTISPYVAGNAWNPNATLSTVTFCIRNYANYLLYNDENIELEYDIYAMVAEADTSGIQYSLGYGENRLELSTTPTKISDRLSGGEPLSKSYSIQYNYSAGIKSLPKTVYVWAVPTAPSYISSALYSMGSAISVREGSSEFSFAGDWKFITLEDLEEALTEEQKNIINSQVGFVYNISTSGSNTKGADKDKVNVSLSWNSNYVELDRFSKLYREAEITTDSNGIKKMNLTINTYTSNDILFYRTKNYNLETIGTKKAFKGLVNAVCTDITTE